MNLRLKTKEEIDNYQKEFLAELCQKILDEQFRGQITRHDDRIEWELPNGIIYKIYLNLVMQEGYIEACYLKENQEKFLTHWHPDIDELYKDLISINTGNVFWVVKKKRFFKDSPIMMEKQQWDMLSDKKRKHYIVL